MDMVRARAAAPTLSAPQGTGVGAACARPDRDLNTDRARAAVPAPSAPQGTGAGVASVRLEDLAELGVYDDPLPSLCQLSREAPAIPSSSAIDTVDVTVDSGVAVSM